MAASNNDNDNDNENEQPPSTSQSQSQLESPLPPRTIRFFDPHFHLWDVSPTTEPEDEDDSTTISGHDGSLVFAHNGSKLYGRVEYEEEVVAASAASVTSADTSVSPLDASGKSSSSGGGGGLVVVHEGGVCIEANSIGFLDQPGSQLTPKYRQELEWTLAQLEAGTDTDTTNTNTNTTASDNDNDNDNDNNKSYRFVACASLESPGVESWLDEIAQRPGVCGIRQILNHGEPSWPRNDALGELLEDDAWKRGFRCLADRGLVFDLQLNPSQFGLAAALIKDTPGARVVINHAGTPMLKDLDPDLDPSDADDARSDLCSYWDGLESLANCPGVIGIKISMLSYTDPKQWDTNPLVVGAVHRVIRMFGAKRVAFASNAPVDGHVSEDSFADSNVTWPVSRVLAAFDAMTASGYGYTEEERSWLFAESAKAMYGLR